MPEERECRWCRYLRELGCRDMERELEEYIRSLPEDVRCGEDEHARRLAICSSCEHCRDGLCAFCGCYVAARTAKSAMRCPCPGAPRW